MREDEILRTRLLTSNKEFHLSVDSCPDLRFNVEYLSNVRFQEYSEKVDSLFNTESTRVTDSEGPSIHLTILSFSNETHGLVVGIPSFISDAEGVENFIRRIEERYIARATGGTVGGGYLQYAELAELLHECLEDDEFETGRNFWKEAVRQMNLYAGPVPQIEAGLESPQCCCYSSAQISPDAQERILDLCREPAVSPGAFLLACWNILIHKRTGLPQRLAIGVLGDGRNLKPFEDNPGNFSRYLPFISKFESAANFKIVLRQTGNTLEDLLRWQQYFSWNLNGTRAGGQPFYFSWGFGYRERRLTSSRSPFPFEILRTRSETEWFDARLEICRDGAAWTCELQYAENVFSADEACNLLRQFNTVIERCLQNPCVRLGDIGLLSEPEAHAILDSFNQTQLPIPGDVCLQNLFESQVERTPNETAVVYEGTQLTYRELNCKANQLACYLRKRGVLPETCVGVSLPRNLEMVIAILGVLKAGGVYVPIDPDAPDERLAYMLATTRAPVLLIEDHNSRSWRVENVSVVALQSDWCLISAEPENNPRPDTVPSNLAYVLFTSGSTGQPKGVTVQHAEVLNYIYAVSERAGLRESMSYAMLQPLTVDSCVTVIFPALCSGGTLHLIGYDVALDGHLISAYFKKHEIDVLKIAPSHLLALHAASASEPVMPQRRLIVGGEASQWQWVSSLRLKTSECEIYNHYGPTETTVGVLMFPVNTDEGKIYSTTPLGRPIANTQAYVLDRDLQPVPFGVMGELCIGGANVARGYLGKPDLTAEKFIPDPFSAIPGQRLYRSGDYVRLWPDLNIEFCGRSDDQVKIRGFRIELQEIEAALRRHPDVSEVVVLAHGDGNSKCLVAYVVPRTRVSSLQRELSEWTKKALPGYMVPAHFVFLKEMPRTPHGKIDRKGFPAPALAPESVSAPETPEEEILCGIWAEVLDRNEVGIHDNFFELGGHSLLATQVISRVRHVLGLELPVRVLFSAPTVAGMAREIQERKRQESSLVQPGITKVNEGGAPLSFAQERLWFLEQLNPGSGLYSIPIAVRLRGTLNTQVLERSIAEIVRRHHVLRSIYVYKEEGPLQVIQPLGFRLPVLDLEHTETIEAEKAVRREIEREAQEGFDLNRGPLFRAMLVRLSAQEHVLLATMHHIVSDGWSMGVMVKELSTLYGAYLHSQPSPLEELPIQYEDYAAWQRKWLDGEIFERQLKYWKEQLAQSEALEINADYPRPLIVSSRGATETFRVSSELTKRLKEVSRKYGVTLFMTLLGGYQVALWRYSRQETITVGTPIAGRTRLETESLIGLFLNTLAMRARVSGNLTVKELLEEIRNTALGAYANQDIPFEKLVDQLQPERSLNRDPLVQVWFDFHNEHRELLALEGITAEFADIAVTWAKFDLTISFQEMNDGLAGQVLYRTDIFHPATMRRFAEHLVRILEGMGEGEQKRIGEISILSGEERRQIVEEWNRTGEDWSESGKKSFIELFEEQVKRRGEREAIADGQQRVSYRELDEQSERVGDYLEQRAGVGRGELVGMLGERGVNFVVGMVGILKMGGVYVPLDPRHPVQRWRQVVQESGMRWMVVSGEMAARVRESEVLEETGVQMIVLEEMLQGGEEERTEGWRGEEGAVDGKEEKKQRRSKGGKELAYVIYTSGSTGVPKGAMVEEAGMVNHLRAKVGELEMGAEDVVAQTAVQSFDISVWQMLAPLVSGGRVVVVGEGEAEEPERLMARLEGEGVTIFETVPAMLQAMVSTVASRREESRDGDGKEREAREREAREEERSSRGEEQPPRDRHHRPQAPFELRKLRWVIVTGEAFTTELWRRWQELYPGMKMMNAYGPTECSDDVTHYRIEGRGREKGEAGAEGEGEAEPQGLYVGIGRPIANTEIYILDEEMEPVPVGVGGEIYVGGEGVGRGYVKRAELTAERFVPNRFSRKAGERLYRTGDLGRYRRDGVVEFLGRVDQQVKVRGYRIELGEIEGVLGKHERVEQAAVVVREDERGEKRLVGYVVRKVGNGEVSREDLRRYMQERLPEYMVPSQVVFMAEMPLTGSGKVDRKQLPKPEVRRGEEEGETGDRYVAPRNEVEEILCGIWAEVLGVERVGIEDNFFQLGGHSLSATRVAVRVRDRFHIELPLQVLFQATTISALAAFIAKQEKSGQARSLKTPIKRLNRASYRVQ
jgi:amino acid adenylation domain-containing protein